MFTGLYVLISGSCYSNSYLLIDALANTVCSQFLRGKFYVKKTNNNVVFVIYDLLF